MPNPSRCKIEDKFKTGKEENKIIPKVVDGRPEQIHEITTHAHTLKHTAEGATSSHERLNAGVSRQPARD